MNRLYLTFAVRNNVVSRVRDGQVHSTPHLPTARSTLLLCTNAEYKYCQFLNSLSSPRWNQIDLWVLRRSCNGLGGIDPRSNSSANIINLQHRGLGCGGSAVTFLHLFLAATATATANFIVAWVKYCCWCFLLLATNDVSLITIFYALQIAPQAQDCCHQISWAEGVTTQRAKPLPVSCTKDRRSWLSRIVRAWHTIPPYQARKPFVDDSHELR